MAQQTSPKLSLVIKLLLGVALLSGLVIAAQPLDLPRLLQNVLRWVDGLGPAGAIAFIAIYALATVLFVPGSILTLSGGALFGVGWGFLYVFTAAVVGATVAFLIGRYGLRNWVTQQLQANAKFSAIDQAVAQAGFKIVLLTRLSPLFPFSLLNYALGVTQVSLKDYLLGSIGMIPGTVLYIYIGSLAGNLATIDIQPTDPQTQTLQWILRIVGFFATLAVTLYITRIAKKALEQL